MCYFPVTLIHIYWGSRGNCCVFSFLCISMTCHCTRWHVPPCCTCSCSVGSMLSACATASLIRVFPASVRLLFECKTFWMDWPHHEWCHRRSMVQHFKCERKACRNYKHDIYAIICCYKCQVLSAKLSGLGALEDTMGCKQWLGSRHVLAHRWNHHEIKVSVKSKLDPQKWGNKDMQDEKTDPQESTGVFWMVLCFVTIIGCIFLLPAHFGSQQKLQWGLWPFEWQSTPSLYCHLAMPCNNQVNWAVKNPCYIPLHWHKLTDPHTYVYIYIYIYIQYIHIYIFTCIYIAHIFIYICLFVTLPT